MTLNTIGRMIREARTAGKPSDIRSIVQERLTAGDTIEDVATGIDPHGDAARSIRMVWILADLDGDYARTLALVDRGPVPPQCHK